MIEKESDAKKKKEIEEIEDARPKKKKNTIKYKVSHQVYKQLQQVELLSSKQIEAYATLLALGEIPDRFGLEAGLDMRLKGLDLLASLKGLKSQKVDVNANVKTDKLDSILEQLE